MYYLLVLLSVDPWYLSSTYNSKNIDTNFLWPNLYNFIGFDSYEALCYSTTTEKVCSAALLKIPFWDSVPNI